MGKTTRKSEMLYVDHDKFVLLAELAQRTRIPRSVLWREALDDLLIKYGVLKENSRQP